MTISTIQVRAKARRATSSQCRPLPTLLPSSSSSSIRSFSVIVIIATFFLLSLTEQQNYDKRHSFYTHGFTTTTTTTIPSHTVRSTCISDKTSTRASSIPTPIFTKQLELNVIKRSSLTTLLRADRSRENEIRRKIMKLKKDGKLQSSSSSPTSRDENKSIDQYADKIQAKVGKTKSKLLSSKLNPELGEAILSSTSSSTVDSDSTSTAEKGDNGMKTDDDNQDDDNEDTFDDEIDEEMLETIQKKLLEKRSIELRLEREQRGTSYLEPDIDDLANQMEEEIKKKKQELEQQQQQQQQQQVQKDGEMKGTKKTTTGIGGTWNKEDDVTSEVDTYRPANGGWGYFPRPKDISRAYGGGKRIERTTTMEDEKRKQDSVEDTREKLRRYREKVGIEVQSEKDHAKEIEEALALGQLAMQRGVYSTAVSALEKVTKYCSTNSKVGGQVFLELAMAYEAVGRTSEAIQVYTTLSSSRMEDIKFNAKRLLYGIESMMFMREEVKSEAFSKKKAAQTFIDTTGLGNIAQNFDEKVYNTAYIDLDRGGGFYRKLTENVVRSIREARQILLKATDSGEIERVKVVQALRSIERKFNDALKDEIKKNALKEEPVAIMNGVPIVNRREELESISTVGSDSFNLGDIAQMKENISGEWKLQLIADSKGDGVSFYNKTLSWQYFDIDEMTYNASGPAGFLKLNQVGEFNIDEKLRIITRKGVSKSGSGAFLTDLLGTSNLSGPVAATNLEQQILSVDSELLITRAVVEKKSSIDTVKEYFTVWRRAETGKYSGKDPQPM